MNAGKELWLFTVSYPYGTNEAFLENELPVLAKRFRKVVLIPLLGKGAANPLPPGVEVRHTVADPYRAASIGEMLSCLPALLTVLRCTIASAPSFGVLRRRWPDLRSRLRQALHRALELKRLLGKECDPDQVVLYSFWTADWATALGLWRSMDPRVSFRSRMMGFDMYAHRAKEGWQMFQRFHVRQAKGLHPISQDGVNAMCKAYPAHAEKFRLSYLATVDHGAGPWAATDVLRIVSCSNLVELKRVHLIAEALCRCNVPVQWTHFGDGAERAKVEAVLRDAPAHVNAALVGSRPNVEVISWYRTNPADVFIHLSRTEGGAPVALQEAASFGIPLLAAEAGGVKEIVTDRTGVLLPNAVDTGSVAALLDGWKGTKWYGEAGRAQVRGAWKERFDAEVVYNAFADILLEG
ncbi:MAG: glycosyltransferase [Flavobacteriales bacterium]